MIACHEKEPRVVFDFNMYLGIGQGFGIKVDSKPPEEHYGSYAEGGDALGYWGQLAASDILTEWTDAKAKMIVVRVGAYSRADVEASFTIGGVEKRRLGSVASARTA